jgi:hypothetical protein
VVSLEVARFFAKINHFSVLANTDYSLGFLVVERDSFFVLIFDTSELV